MDWTDPASAVVSSLDAAVLEVLAGTTHPLTGREIARMSRRGSKTGVQSVLSRLQDHGLVETTEAGPARLYVLNREHVAAPAVLALQGLRAQTFARMRDALASWDPAPLAAAVFGSAARGDGGTASDVDILVIRPDGIAPDEPRWGAQVDSLSQSVRRWTGNPATILQVTTGDLADMVARQEPVAESLRRDAVSLSGASLTALLPVAF